MAELPFWHDLYHIRQFWYQIENLLEKCFQMIYISFYLSELPFVASPILCNTNIRFSISKNAFKWYIILFGWITFFGVTHTVLCNTNIRFRISLKNAFKWYIYQSFYLSELPFVASPILYYVILISDSASPQKMLSNDISSYLAELPFLASPIPY